MIKIKLKSDYPINTETKCNVTIADEATTTDAVEVFCDILKIAGYADISVMSALYETADDIKQGLQADKVSLHEQDNEC